MKKKLNKNSDPIFKKRFGISTPIRYLVDIEVEKPIKERFNRSWKRFYRNHEPIISPYRHDRFEAFFRQLKKDGSDERYCRRVEIRFISPQIGYGVFAKESIPPYSTLHHYAGLLMLDQEIDPDHDSTFSFTDLKRYSIDAMQSGNWTRFMNHGEERGPKTNVIPLEFYLKDHGPRIVFVSASSGIKKGEQLLYSYGDTYWEEKGKFVSF